MQPGILPSVGVIFLVALRASTVTQFKRVENMQAKPVVFARNFV